MAPTSSGASCLLKPIPIELDDSEAEPEPPAKWARTDGARPCGGGQQKEPHSRPRGIVTAEDLQLIQVETRLKQAAGAGVQTDLSGRTRTGLVRTDLSVFLVEMMHEVMFIGVVGML